jgi:succinate-acetate transporter protein
MAKAKTANPAPLGLLGFGMTTVLLNLYNAQIINGSAMSMILSMGIFYGGLAQIIAGIWELKLGNTFGATAFTSYGLFWLTFVGINFFPAMGLITPIAEPAVRQLALVPYLFIWGLFTFWMFLGTMKTNRVLQFVFLSLSILFWLLALGHYAYWNSWNATGVADSLINVIAGYEGIICGFSAIYLAMAEVLNETYGKDVMPIGRIQ